MMPDLSQLDLSTLPPGERVVVEEYLSRRAKRRKGDSFLDYTLHVCPWFVVEEVHVLIARHLEKLRSGGIDRLMIQMPPRTGKSLMTSELLPAWWEGHYPSDKILHASYAATLVEKFGRKIRNTLSDPAYQEIFPSTRLSKDSKASAQWATTEGGEYNAVGVGGGVAGKGGNLLIIDDPVNEQDMFSTSVMNSVYEWYGAGFYTRRQPDRNALLLTMCMTGDTPVLMADGTEKSLVDVRPRDLVATYDDGKLAVAKVVNHKSSGLDTVFTVRTRSGRTLRANERHPFLVDFEGCQKWIRLRHLKPGYRLVRLKGAEDLPELGTLKPPRSQNLSLGTCDFTVDEIVSVEETGYEEVFDVEIERTENFIANGIVSHNTRWRVDDLVGRLLADAVTKPGADQWTVLKIPAIIDQHTADLLNDCSSDPHIQTPYHYKPGDSFSPRRWPLPELLRTKNTITRKAWASLYLQSPTEEEGGILQRQWWRQWPESKPLPSIEYLLQSYDTAHDEGESHDFSARTTWGVFRRESDGRLCAMPLERMKERLEFPKLLDAALEAYREYKPDRVIIEKAASGAPLIQELRRRGVPVSPVVPKGSKVARAHASTILLEQGVIYYPNRKWAEELIDECAEFPNGPHDDTVDTVTQALNYLRRMFLLETPEDEEDEDAAVTDDKNSKRSYATRRSRLTAAA